MSRKADIVTGKKRKRDRPGAVALLSKNSHNKRHEVSLSVEKLVTFFNIRGSICVVSFLCSDDTTRLRPM